ncbi:MAG: aminotransferase class V-fold PLP-dependent enzyme [Christensenellaceae bacterium]|jgi:cysteine desulfurase|nr:aminotransferase class V-fold PLP-dependent enzyme [Christensenellaceae bacterium]
MIYLDYAADTPVDPLVIETLKAISSTFYGNPNAAHKFGLQSRDLITGALTRIAQLLDLDNSYEIIPLSSASEANNLAIRGIAESYTGRGKRILSVISEHSSVSGTLTHLKNNGWIVDLVRLKSNGIIDFDHLKSLLTPDTVLLSLATVESELGVIQPLNQILHILKDYPNCKFHTDATQAVGKLMPCYKGIDCITFAAHKFYGFNGAGFLARHKETILTPIIHGHGGISIYHSGTPSAPLIASACKALELATASYISDLKHITNLNTVLREKLELIKGVKIFSPKDATPYILNIGIKNIKSTDICDCLDSYNVCVSSKSACTPRGMPSKIVFAITGNKADALSSFRISLGRQTTLKEINEFLDILGLCLIKLCHMTYDI